ncbi:MAG: hypothetical protein Q9M92_17130, partial [Enterobacterales bacterium]|nr:hypothetical protein [Enterobacterales bacterium]
MSFWQTDLEPRARGDSEITRQEEWHFHTLQRQESACVDTCACFDSIFCYTLLMLLSCDEWLFLAPCLPLPPPCH